MGERELNTTLEIREFIQTLLDRIVRLEEDIEDLRQQTDLNNVSVKDSDTAPTEDDSLKRLSVQRKSTLPPSNAAYIAFTNNPGTDTFYLVLEDV